MPITLYRAGKDRIEKVEVLESNLQTVVLANGRRDFKDGPFGSYHETFESAKERLVIDAEKLIATARRGLDTAHRWLEIVKNLEETPT